MGNLELHLVKSKLTSCINLTFCAYFELKTTAKERQLVVVHANEAYYSIETLTLGSSFLTLPKQLGYYELSEVASGSRPDQTGAILIA